ncbi:PREDICTED: proline-rich protein 32, partial [Miniopterus natalensis]|uniref:proline-rich protein 32 n=1 Tax=Miniopterus natalensis TaxID=291302 RepID=UPI0007A6D6FC
RDRAATWGKPRLPLRRPFYVPPDLGREPLKGPWDRDRSVSCVPVDSPRALKLPHGPQPAAAKESPATAEANSSEGLAGWRQKGHDSTNVSPKFPGGPPSRMIQGAGVSTEGGDRGGSNAKFHGALPRGQGFFPLGGPELRGAPPVPAIRSGVMMELSPGNMRLPGNDGLAQVSFPPGGPWHPVDNWPRPITVPPGVARLGWLASGPPCFMPPGPPRTHPFLNIPMPFAPPAMYRPPLPSYFPNFPSSDMPPPASSNREKRL